VIYRILTDHLGSVRLVINATDITISQRMDYDAWGNVVAHTNPGFQPFGYAGGLYDRDAGLTRFGARDYNPAVGRWTAKDPIGFAGGDSNHYSYVAITPAMSPTQRGFWILVAVCFTPRRRMAHTWPRPSLLRGTSSRAPQRALNDFVFVEGQAIQNGPRPVFGLDYLRDNLGRITSLFDTVAGMTTIHEYSYDVAGRLSTVMRNGAEVASYTYDPNGNRLTATGERPSSGVYDAQDRLLSDGTSTYTYRGSGELLTKTTGSVVTVYNYDALGNLISASLPGGRTIEYVVDGASRRVGKKVNGALVQGFLYSSTLRIAAELDRAGTVVSRFVYGTRINVPEYMQRGGVTHRILTDHLGSVRLVINTTDNTITQRMDYDAWGNVVTDTNPGFEPFGYAGGLYDRDTGLTRFGARDYDPAVGRWTAKDPIGFGGGDADLYAYVDNNPSNALDPFGLVVINRSGKAVIVKPESGPPGTVAPGATYPGKVDGVMGPDGKWLKFSGKESWWSPDNTVEVTPSGEVKCVGGLCKLVPPKKLNEDPDPTWKVPKDPKPLPGCKATQ